MGAPSRFSKYMQGRSGLQLHHCFVSYVEMYIGFEISMLHAESLVGADLTPIQGRGFEQGAGPGAFN
jgi:hypothetical protein